MTERPLTEGERSLVRSMFGDAIDCSHVSIRRRKWFPFQPRQALMAPTGHIHAHPNGELWSDDYSRESVARQALFLHEMTHVWQTQHRGTFYLPLMRHPFCRYRYRLVPGRKFEAYGLEQQAEIVRHLHLRRNGAAPTHAPERAVLEQLIPFGSAA
jgi:hypothetical protein